ncbi:MAG: exosortase A [Thiobacillus sp.]
MTTLVTGTTAGTQSWRFPAALMGGVLIALGVLYWPTFFSMIEIWERSETFTHGYVIFPISAWLIWQRRDTLSAISPVPDWRGLGVLVIAGLIWLLADAGGVRVAAQYAFILTLVGAVWTVLGWRFFCAIFFPLMFLFFAVPVGEFLIPPMMEFTADFTVAALKLTGIPVYREGNYFSLPSGDWSVVEACSGLRYLIASVTLGSLYAYLTYRSPRKRLLFFALAIAVPVLANGVRAYMIVMIGHLSGMEYAVGADHLIYGWVFFGVVMLLLFWVGSFWREDDQDVVSPVLLATTNTVAPASMLATSAVVLGLASVWIGYAHYLESRPLPTLAALKVASAQGWQQTSPLADWKPHWLGADQRYQASYRKQDHTVMLDVNYYVTQRQGSELVNSQNYMVGQTKYEHWLNVGETLATVEVGGVPRLVRQAQMKSKAGQRLLVWQWNVVNGRATVNDSLAKALMALKRVSLQRDDGTSVLIAAPYINAPDEAARVLEQFVADMEPAVETAILRVVEQ